MDSEEASSVTSSSLASGPDSPVALQRSAREIFKSRIFLGRYVDRRLVSEALGYRDLVLVSAAEQELQRDLLELRRELVAQLPPSHWVGVTDTRLLTDYKPGVCVWTEIDEQPFGAFWFQIRAVEFRAGEVSLRLRCLRLISDRFLELEPVLVEGSRPPGATDGSTSGEICIESLLHNCKLFVASMRSNLTVANIKDFLFFIFALMIATFTGSIAFVSYLGTFTLSLLKEMSNLIKNSTPLLLGFLEFISKIIGGFYILLAMIFKQTSPPPSFSRQIQPYNLRGNAYRRSNDDYGNLDRYSKDFD